MAERAGDFFVATSGPRWVIGRVSAFRLFIYFILWWSQRNGLIANIPSLSSWNSPHTSLILDHFAFLAGNVQQHLPTDKLLSFFGQQVFDLSSWCIHARFRLHLLVKKLSIRLCVYFQCVSYFFPSHRFQIIWFLCNQFGIVVSIACKYSPWNVHVATLARSVTVLSLWNDSSYQMSCDRPPNDFVQ